MEISVKATPLLLEAHSGHITFEMGKVIVFGSKTVYSSMTSPSHKEIQESMEVRIGTLSRDQEGIQDY